MRQLLKSVLKVAFDFELDELSVSLQVTRNVPIQNLIISELEQELSALLIIPLVGRCVQPLLQLDCKLLIHD